MYREGRMQRGFSTYVFLEQRLGGALLDMMLRTGAKSMQVFAARHHFDYLDRGSVRELATWFRSNNVEATLHMPVYPDTNWSKHLAATLNLIHIEKARRIDAMDEVKRALESAEQIPFTAIVLHLGNRDDQWSSQALEHSMTAIEHLKAFAHPLGVKVVLENLLNEVSTPEHLMEIMKVGHFDNVGIALDIGHAHLTYGGVEAAFEACSKRVTQMHINDNHGTRDEHLWPGDGDVDWKAVMRGIATLPEGVPAYLETAHELGEDEGIVEKKAAQAWAMLEKARE